MLSISNLYLKIKNKKYNMLIKSAFKFKSCIRLWIDGVLLPKHSLFYLLKVNS